MTTQHATNATETQVGIVCSTAAGPAGMALARLLGLPTSGCDSAELEITAVDPADLCTPTIWRRTFGAKTWSSTMAVTPTGEITERAGPATLRFDVDVNLDRLVMRSSSVRIGPFALPWRDVVTVVVAAIDEKTVTTVTIELGRLGRLRYVATMSDGAVDMGAAP